MTDPVKKVKNASQDAEAKMKTSEDQLSYFLCSFVEIDFSSLRHNVETD
jgi:hypothetical protein